LQTCGSRTRHAGSGVRVPSKDATPLSSEPGPRTGSPRPRRRREGELRRLRRAGRYRA
jgi:hypothetical protein